MHLIRSVESEWIKRKRSAATWLTVIGGFFIPTIILFSKLVQKNQTILSNASDGVWQKISNQCWQYMSIFLLPLGIILATSLIAQIEFKNNAWKQTLTTPQSLNTLFWAKFIVVLVMMLQFFILFNIGIYLVGIVPAIVYSDVPFPVASFPFRFFALENLKIFTYCLPILGLQYLLSLHVKNFIIPIAIGFALLIASLIAMNWEHGYLLPYCYTSLRFLLADNKTNPFINIQALAIGYFSVFMLVNYFLFLAKSENRFTFFVDKISRNKKKASAVVLLVLLAGSLIVYAILKNENKPLVLADTHSPKAIEDRISQVEQNLGAFILEGVSDWSLAERMKFHQVNGLSIAVINNFNIEWAKGYGWADSAAQIPVTPNTLFIPGSMSKSVNAVGIFTLVRDKKVDLFTDVNQYLSSWKFPYDSVSKNKKITLLQLLSHTAGLSVHGFYGYQNGDSLPTVPQILDGAKPANSKAVRSLTEPNLNMKYSGGGTMISQLVLMDITKQNYDGYLQKAVLGPMGMTNSFFTQPPPADMQNLLATGYDSLGRELSGKYPIMAEQAAAGLWTNSTDMCKFVIELQQSYLGKSNKVLSKELTALMLTPYLDERTALGFFVDNIQGHTYVSHEAGNSGFSGAFWGSLEDGKGVAIMINSENSDILREVGNSVMEVYQWKGFPRKVSAQVVELPDTTAAKYLGDYQSITGKGNKINASIYKKDTHYWYRVDGEVRKLYFTSDTEFVSLETPSKKRFYFDKKNQVLGFSSTYQNTEWNFKKIE